MIEDGEWMMLQKPAEKDWWRPTRELVGGPEEVANDSSSDPLKLKFDGPATHWTDAVPIGNGRLGAMVWGAVVSEILNLNEDTLWTGNPGNYTNPNAPKALTEVRKLVDDGKYAEATTAAVQLSGEHSAVYQLLGDLKIDFDDSHAKYAPESYRRELDLNTATTKVVYSIDDTEFTREHFTSNPDQVIATRISGSKPGSLSFTVSLDSKMHHHSYANGTNQIIMEGSCPGEAYPSGITKNDNPTGVQFCMILDLVITGEKCVVHVVDDKKLMVEHSDSAVFLIVASSSFSGPFTKPSDSKKDPTLDSHNQSKSIATFSYQDLYMRHLDDYQKLFHRVTLQLSNGSKSSIRDEIVERKKPESLRGSKFSEGNKDSAPSAATRVKSFQTDEDPNLVELLFQYGRYLLIACSRPRTQVANLQGIWNNEVAPPWDGAQHLNINLQMNYWPALPCNLQECQEPLFDYTSELSVTGTRTATVNYEASGWVAHQVSDIWAKSSPDTGQAVWALWPMGGAWLCTHLWEHYSFTMDKEFLKNKAYPLLEGCTAFLLDWLIDGPGGYLETNPSTSPEHTFTAPDGKAASVSYSSTMDMSIIKEVFSAIVSAAEVLGKNEDDLIQKVLKAQPRLYPTKIARDGSIMEWVQDFQDPEPHHRHVSHLFGLFPGHTISLEKTPDLCKAADYTLYKRGEKGPGWSTTWKVALWARLHNSEHAYRMVKHLFDLVDPDHADKYEGGLYSNLFTAHPPFQIDANFGFAAGIAEMLVQSTIKDLYLLPALPRDKWPNGCVKGLKARGGVTVNISWGEGDLQEVGLWSKERNSVLRLHYRGTTVPAKLSSGKIYTFNNLLRCVRTNSMLFS